MAKVTVIGSKFTASGQEGDFGWMLAQSQYHDAFFIFNDNQSQFLAHQRAPGDKNGPGCAAGGGNAAIRPYQCAVPPRAGGIPTGEYGITGGPGYPELSPYVKMLIDQAVAAIRAEVTKTGYARVFYSSDGHGGLGHGIFDPADDVKKCIIYEINSLAS